MSVSVRYSVVEVVGVLKGAVLLPLHARYNYQRFVTSPCSKGVINGLSPLEALQAYVASWGAIHRVIDLQQSEAKRQ